MSRSGRSAALVAVLALLVAGCGGASPLWQPQTPSVDSEESTDQGQVRGADDSAVDGDLAQRAEDLAAGGGSSVGGGGTHGSGPGARPPRSTAPVTEDGCVVGTWLLDNNRFTGLLHELGAEPVTSSGRTEVAIGADGAVTVTYTDWRMLLRAPAGEMTMTRNGTDRGTFVTRVDGSFTLQETRIGSGVMLRLTSPSGPIDVGPERAEAGAIDGRYQCHPDRLWLAASWGGGVSLLTRQR